MQSDKLVVDRAPVGLELGLAGAADEAKPAALPFKVGPGPNQPRALIGQRRHLDLQHALARRRTVREDLEDQPGAVEDLDLPGLFQIALLHRRHRSVDQHKLDLVLLDPGAQFLDLAGAEQVPRMRLGQPHDLGALDLDPRQRLGQRHGLLECRA